MQLLWFTPAKGLAFCHCGLAGISVFVVFSFRLPREESYQTKGTRAKMAKVTAKHLGPAALPV